MASEQERDALIETIESVMPGDTVWTRDYGNVQIAPDVGDLVDALLMAGYRRTVGPEVVGDESDVLLEIANSSVVSND